MNKIKLTIKGEELKKKLNLKDGERGPKGERGERGPLGPKGDKGFDAIPIDTSKIVLEAQKGVLDELLPKIPTIPQITEQIPLEAEKIRDALELLVGENRLSIDAIRDIQKLTTKENFDRAFSILDQRTQFLLNKTDRWLADKSNYYTKTEIDEAGFTTDEKVKYDAGDPTAGYLSTKTIAGNGITLSEGTDVDENKLKISTTWLLDPVEEHWDITAGLPPAPEDGERYISDGTDKELGWYDGYIYEWDEDDGEWYETMPVEGMLVWLIFEMVWWAFFSGGWMEIGSNTFVPYTGATDDVDLGAHDLQSNGVLFSNKITGDGIHKITVGVSAPTDPEVGDMWLDTSGL